SGKQSNQNCNADKRRKVCRERCKIEIEVFSCNTIKKRQGYIDHYQRQYCSDESDRKRFSHELKDELLLKRTGNFSYPNLFGSCRCIGRRQVDVIDCGQNQDKHCNGTKDIDVGEPAAFVLLA